MQEIERNRKPMKSPTMPFDESKLSPGQREAVAIAKAQGKDLTLTIKDLAGNMDHKLVEELMEVVLHIRKHPAKSRIF